MNKEEFLTKIGVTLPSPQVHPQFGTELPQVYLDRCLNLIIPVVEKKLKDTVNLDDIIEYLKKYNKEETKRISIEEDSKIHQLSHKGTPRSSDKKKKKKIFAYYKNNPNKSIGDCSDAIGITYTTVGRYSKMLYKEGKLENVGTPVKFIFKVSDNSSRKIKKDVVFESVKTKEPVSVKKEVPVTEVKSNAIPSSYLQDLKQRFEKRNINSDEPKLPSWPGFVVQRYFDSLSRELKEKAITEFWMITNVSPDEYKQIVELYKAAGYTVIRQKLTKLQYEMLMQLVSDGILQNKTVMQEYYEYVR